MAEDDDVQPIFELRSKIVGLMKWAQAAGRTRLSTLRGLDEQAHVIRYSTLQSSMERESISFRNQKALAKAFGFSVNWREWRDPDTGVRPTGSERTDSAKAFLKRFEAQKLSGARLTIEAGTIRTNIDRRFADFSLGLPGSFESAENKGVPLLLALSFDRRGWPVFPDLTVGLKQVDLQLSYERSGASIDTVAITCDRSGEGNFEASAEGLSPWWIISVANGGSDCLSGRRRRNDGEDCICNGFRAGDQIRALMTARVSDCFVKVSGQPFEDSSEPKIQFIEHLLKLAALKGAEAILGEQVLTVIEIHE